LINPIDKVIDQGDIFLSPLQKGEWRSGYAGARLAPRQMCLFRLLDHCVILRPPVRPNPELGHRTEDADRDLGAICDKRAMDTVIPRIDFGAVGSFPFHAARLLKAANHRLPTQTPPKKSSLQELLALRISPIRQLKMLRCVPATAIIV
jgi:hypothetical protein